MEINEKKYVLGIDPGLQGALVAIDDEGLPQFFPMPIIGNEIDTKIVRDLLFRFTIKSVYIEHVGTHPSWGLTPTFSFGKGFGKLLAALEIMEIPHQLVKPAHWQKWAFRGTDDSWPPKQRALLAAQRLYPSESFKTPAAKRPHDGLVDALLIAAFGWHEIKGVTQ